MKSIEKYIILGMLTSFSLGCSKSFLEIEPKGSFVAEKTEDYDRLFNNSSLLGMGGDTPAIFLGDETATLSTYYANSPIRVKRLFEYTDEVYNPGEEAEELKAPIAHIYLYNKIINEVRSSTGGSEQQKEAILAEARASRAFENLYLINYYGKPYNSGSAGTDLGIPIILDADVSQTNFTRSSVQAVYDFIIKDLTESIQVIPVNAPVRSRMSRAAAECTLAKVYFYMGRYQESLALINTALSHLPSSFPVALYDYSQTYLSASWSVQNIFDIQENLLARNSSSTVVSQSNNLLLAPWANNLYGSTDLRLKSFSTVPSFGSGNYPVAGLKRRTGPFGGTAQVGIVLPDVYLMKAECEARTVDVVTALNTLNEFRRKRISGSAADVSIINREELIRFIVEERVREFALMGRRWFDMRRLNKDPIFTGISHSHIQYDAVTGTQKEAYTLPEKRLTLRFATKVIEQNPGMQNNP